MIEFIQRLQKRYLSVQQAASADSNLRASCAKAIKTLTLAETSLLNQQFAESSPESPLDIVIFGPTQAGKSTLVNCLLPEPLAGVSPLAGYTVHPHGFSTGTLPSDTWFESVYPNFQRFDQKSLDHSDLAGYTLTELKSSRIDQKSSIIWDTPDFDSVDASGYIEGVLRTIGFADVLILIVSKEKYADQSVWELLELLAPLEQTLLVCINKLASGEDATLFRSFENRYKNLLPDFDLPELVSMPFIETGSEHNSDQIIEKINSLIRNIDHKNLDYKNKDKTSNFIELYWRDWIKPVEEEINDQNLWNKNFQTATDSAMQTYRREFLDHPDYYDTFQRAMAELLVLLEVPGLAQSLGKAREVITWPIRNLIKFGKSVINSETEEIKSTRDKSYEEALLRQLADQIMTELAKDILADSSDEQSHSGLWQQKFRRTLSQSRQRISDQFEQQVSDYQTGFEYEIQDAAKQLYSGLEEQPALLNSLRAARVTTDAAAVVFALKTGGLSLNDFILAPAMLSLSTMLTESSVGQYINTVKAKLKAQQFERVEALFVDHLQKELDQLRDETAIENKFLITELEIREVENEYFEN